MTDHANVLQQVKSLALQEVIFLNNINKICSMAYQSSITSSLLVCEAAGWMAETALSG